MTGKSYGPSTSKKSIVAVLLRSTLQRGQTDSGGTVKTRDWVKAARFAWIAGRPVAMKGNANRNKR